MRRCSVQCIDEIFNGLRPQGFDFRSEAVYCAERTDMKRAPFLKRKDALRREFTGPSVRSVNAMGIGDCLEAVAAHGIEQLCLHTGQDAGALQHEG